MAVNMKGEVRELLSRGYSERQVLRYFEHSYGQFVLLDPPRRGINWLVWLLPLLLLATGAVIVRRTLRQQPVEVAAPAVDDDDLAPYLARVRAIAYGSNDR
jgi:cytochrome c-type biogenesis protein CcmH